MRSTVEDRAPDVDVAESLRADRVGIFLEYGEVRALAHLNRSDLGFKPEAASALAGDGAQRRVACQSPPSGSAAGGKASRRLLTAHGASGSETFIYAD